MILDSKNFDIILLTACLLIFSSNIFSQSYYVSLTGIDSNNGSIENPWATIQFAVDQLNRGDTLLVREGMYSEQISITKSGDTNGHIIISNYEDESVIIDGSGLLSSNYDEGIIQSNASYIKIIGFKIINSGNIGILLDNSSNCTIANNITYNTFSSGIAVWNSKSITIINNSVELACSGDEASFNECITVGNTKNFVVEGNHVFNGGLVRGEGIDLKDGSENGKVFDNVVHDITSVGIYIDSWNKNTKNIRIFNNKIFNARGDGISLASEAGGLLENISIYNNIIYNNENMGITIANWGEDTVSSRPIENILITHNTIVSNGSGDWGGGISIENPDLKQLVISNNILKKNLLFQIALSVPSQSDYDFNTNLIYGFKNYGDEILGDNYIDSSPRFVEEELFNFQLQQNSPAIDAGNNAYGLEKDFLYIERPLGNGYDIGAYEYNPTTDIKNNETVVEFKLEQNYPNPFNPTTIIEYSIPADNGSLLNLIVQLHIYNMLGQKVATLVDEQKSTGSYQVRFNSSNLASGLYYYQLQYGEYIQTKKMILLK